MIIELLDKKGIKCFFRAGKIVLTIFIIVIALIILVQRISRNNFTLFGIQLYTIITESMSPAYNLHDMLIVREVPPTTLKIGDDITYLTMQVDPQTLTHRIIRIEYDEDGKLIFITKGLVNDIEDPPVYPEQIFGKVVYRTLVLSFLSKLLNNIYGFYFLVFIPMATLLFFEIMHEVNKRKQKELFK